MIQLATEATASRPSYHRPPQGEGQGSTLDARRRPGHAWPFLSRYAARPAQQQGPKPTANDSGS